MQIQQNNMPSSKINSIFLNSRASNIARQNSESTFYDINYTRQYSKLITNIL